jgi:CRP/FNR family transcriptional regulator, cyclic AMP receptor protein
LVSVCPLWYTNRRELEGTMQFFPPLSRVGDLFWRDFYLGLRMARNVRVEADLIDHLFNSSEKRLARTLLLLARYGAPGQPQKVLPKVSQEMLVEMIGTTRSRVNFFMNKFRKLGFLQYGGEIRVNDSLLGVVLHD